MAGNGAGVQTSNGWIIIDGTGKTCAGILAALTAQIELDAQSFIEVIIPDVLNAYDVVVWAEEHSHNVLTQRKDESGTTRMLISPDWTPPMNHDEPAPRAGSFPFRLSGLCLCVRGSALAAPVLPSGPHFQIPMGRCPIGHTLVHSQ